MFLTENFQLINLEGIRGIENHCLNATILIAT